MARRSTSTTVTMTRSELAELIADEVAKATGKPAKTATKATTAAKKSGFSTQQQRADLATLKRQGKIPTGISATAAIKAGLMTEDGKPGPKVGKAKAEALAQSLTGSRPAKTEAKAKPAKKASAKPAKKAAPAKRTAAKAPLKGDQVAKSAGGSLKRKDWDRTLTAKARLSGLVVGKKSTRRSLYAAVTDPAVWAIVVAMRDEDGLTPNQAFADLVDATKAKAPKA